MSRILFSAAVLLAASTAAVASETGDDEGVVRITGTNPVPAVPVAGQIQLTGARASCDTGCVDDSCTSGTCDAAGACSNGRCGLGNGAGRSGYGHGGLCGRGNNCRSGECRNGNCPECNDGRCRNCNGAGCMSALARMKAFAACKFGYLCPAANCGQGAHLLTKYGMVYSLDPAYADARDGERYAAPYHNMHMNMPLAPVVRHSYNYSWGVPSSRLTPVRHGSVVGPPQPAYAHPLAGPKPH